jgi:beta-phosphoglucomutase
VRYRGVIFDFNGVLVFDSPLHEEAWREVSRELRGVTLSESEMNERVHGRTNRAIFEYVADRPVADDELAGLVERKETFYRALCRKDPSFALSPGAVELLDHIRDRGIPRTIATSSEKVNLAFFFSTLDLERWFSREQVVYDDGTRPGKPAPDVYLAASAQLGLDPAACVVVEDALSGIEAARRAGIGRIYALGPTSRHSALLAAPGVHDILETLSDFPRDELHGAA